MSLFDDIPEWMPPEDWPDLRGSTFSMDFETVDPLLKTHGPSWAYPAQANGFICGVAIAFRDSDGEMRSSYYPIAHRAGNVDREKTMRWLKDHLGDPSTTIVCHNALYDVGWSTALIGPPKAKIKDTMTAAALLDENRWSYSLSACVKTWAPAYEKTSVLLQTRAESFGVKDPWSNMDKLPPMIVAPYGQDDAECTLALWEQQRPLIDLQGLTRVFEMEMRLQRSLISMRMRGVRVDVPRAEAAAEEIAAQEKSISDEITRLAGRSVEIWASESITHALDGLDIDYPLTPAGAPSFTAEWLSSHPHKVPQLIVQQRQLYKTRATFVENYVLGHAVDGRIHAQFHPLRSEDDAGKGRGAVTGRFASSDPNLQNLSSRNPEVSGVVRKLFLPEEGCRWLSADYASQEPRLMVHYAAVLKLTGVQELVDAYRSDPKTDFHGMAAQITGLPRKQTKDISLGIAYGMGGATLAASMGLEVVDEVNERTGRSWRAPGPEAREIMQRYNEKFPFVKELADSAQRRAETTGEVRTLLGRKRRFLRKNEKPRKGDRRAFPYKALNAVIQGSAADQTKESIIASDDAGVLPAVTVHDENGYSFETDRQKDLAIEAMRDCVLLEIPSYVDAEIGATWGDAV